MCAHAWEFVFESACVHGRACVRAWACMRAWACGRVCARALTRKNNEWKTIHCFNCVFKFFIRMCPSLFPINLFLVEIFYYNFHNSVRKSLLYLLFLVTTNYLYHIVSYPIFECFLKYCRIQYKSSSIINNISQKFSINVRIIAFLSLSLYLKKIFYAKC